MNKLLVLLMVCFTLNANQEELENSFKLLSEELSPSEINQELKALDKYSEIIKETFPLEAKAYSQTQSSRFDILDKLLKLESNSSSLAIAQYLIDKTFMYVSMKDFKKFYKYTDGAYNKLYDRKLCDGYLLKGDYTEKVLTKKLLAFKIYEDGYKSCKVKHKAFSLRSRYNILKYRLKK